MLKKYTWIVAALVTLAMVFSFIITGCEDGRDFKVEKLNTTPKFQMSTDTTIQNIAGGTTLTNSSSPWLVRSGGNGHITFEDIGGTIGILVVNPWEDAGNTIAIRTNSFKNFYKGEGYTQGRTHVVYISGKILSNIQVLVGENLVNRKVGFAGGRAGVVNDDGTFVFQRAFTWDQLSSTPTIGLNLGAADGGELIVIIDEIVVAAAHECGCVMYCLSYLKCIGDKENDIKCHNDCLCSCCVTPWNEPVLLVERVDNWVGVDMMGPAFNFQLGDIIDIKVIGVTEGTGGGPFQIMLTTFAGNQGWGNRLGTGGSMTISRDDGDTWSASANPTVDVDEEVLIKLTLNAGDMALLGIENKIRIMFNDSDSGNIYALEQITVTRGGSEIYNFATILGSLPYGPLSNLNDFGPHLQTVGGVPGNVIYTIDGP